MLEDSADLIRSWLDTIGDLDPDYGWAQVDVVDLVADPPGERLFDWSVRLFVDLVSQLTEKDSGEAAILVVPLEYSEGIDLNVPKLSELDSIGSLVEVPGLYRSLVLMDAWQPVEQYRLLVDLGLDLGLGVLSFYSCWRSLDARSADEPYARNLHLLWKP